MNTWIVVLNWNGMDDTLACIESIEAARASDTTILLVDNGSTDGTVEAAQARFPNVCVLQNGSNLGFAAGNNRGITQAIEQGAEVVVVLNNDTVVTPGFLDPLVELAASGAAVSPDIRYMAEPDTSWFYGGRLRDHVPVHLGALEQPPRERPAETEFVTGCCLAASAATWATVGGFDERYFLIFEDSDWSMRARRAGVPLLLQPGSVIYHKVSSSIDASPRGFGIYYYARNGLRFVREWFGVAPAIRFAWRSVIHPGLADLRRRSDGRCMQLRAGTVGLVDALTGRTGEIRRRQRRFILRGR